MGSVKVISRNEAFKTRWFTIQEYDYESDQFEGARKYYVHEAPPSVMCVCVTPNGLIPLVRQYRVPSQCYNLDYPAGYVEPGDDSLEDAARRELLEETGLRAGSLQYLLRLQKDPGFSSSLMHVFLATDVATSNSEVSKKDVQVVYLTPEEILESIRQSEITCALCVAATFWAARTLRWQCLMPS